MPDTYYICFTEATRPLWYMRYLKRNYSHCFVLQPHKGQWLKYESGHGSVRVDLIDDYADILNKCIIVKYYSKSKSKGPLMLATCVGFVKHIIGVNNLSLTPYQLYRSLRKWDY